MLEKEHRKLPQESPGHGDIDIDGSAVASLGSSVESDPAIVTFKGYRSDRKESSLLDRCLSYLEEKSNGSKADLLQNNSKIKIEIFTSAISLLKGLSLALVLDIERGLIKKWRQSSLDSVFKHDSLLKHVYSLIDQVLNTVSTFGDYLSYSKYAKMLVNEPMNRFSDNPTKTDIKFSGPFRKFINDRTHRGALSLKNCELWSDWSQAKRASEPYPDEMVYQQYASHIDSITSTDILSDNESQEYLSLVQPLLDRIIKKTERSFGRLVNNYQDTLISQKGSTSACKEFTTRDGGAEGYLMSVALFNYLHRDYEAIRKTPVPGMNERDNALFMEQLYEPLVRDQKLLELEHPELFRKGGKFYGKDTSKVFLLDPDLSSKNCTKERYDELLKEDPLHWRCREFKPASPFERPSHSWEKKIWQDHNKSRTLRSDLGFHDIARLRRTMTEKDDDEEDLLNAFGESKYERLEWGLFKIMTPLVISTKELLRMGHEYSPSKIGDRFSLNNPSRITSTYARSHYAYMDELPAIIDRELEYFKNDIHPLPTVVHALKEPQKIRIITKGSALPYYLTKGLQVIIHTALREEPSFRLIGRTISPLDFEEMVSKHMDIYKTTNGFSWFSGDYQSSTDALSNKLSKSILTYLLDGMSTKTTDRIKSYKNLALSTLFGQKVTYNRLYPNTEECSQAESDEINAENQRFFDEFIKKASTLCSDRKIEHKVQKDCLGLDKQFTVVQKNGQLMGSLLSFPILCIVNYALYLRVTEKDRGVDFDEDPEKNTNVMVNGDDILYICNLSNNTHQVHAEYGASLGLKMSPGKSFISTTFAQVNSMNYYHPLDRRFKRSCTLSPFPIGLFFGKQKNQQRVTGSKDDNEEDLIRRRPFTGTMNRIFQVSYDAKLKVKLLNTYLRIHKKDIQTEVKNRNIFLPPALGGMGVHEVKGYSWHVTPQQHKVAIYHLTNLVLEARSFGLIIKPKIIGPQVGPSLDYDTDSSPILFYKDTCLTLTDDNRKSYSEVAYDNLGKPYALESEASESLSVHKSDDMGHSTFERDVLPLEGEMRINNKLRYKSEEWSCLYKNLEKKYSINQGIRKFNKGIDIIRKETSSDKMTGTWTLSQERITYTTLLHKKGVYVEGFDLINMSDFRFREPACFVTVYQKKVLNDFIKWNQEDSNEALRQAERYSTMSMNPNMARYGKSQWVLTPDYTHFSCYSSDVSLETDTITKSETVPQERRNAIHVFNKCRIITIEGIEEIKELSEQSWKLQLEKFQKSNEAGGEHLKVDNGGPLDSIYPIAGSL